MISHVFQRSQRYVSHTLQEAEVDTQVVSIETTTNGTNYTFHTLMIQPSFSSYGATAEIGSWPPLLTFLNHTQLDTR
jgi:hypothetical protein